MTPWMGSNSYWKRLNIIIIIGLRLCTLMTSKITLLTKEAGKVRKE